MSVSEIVEAVTSVLPKRRPLPHHEPLRVDSVGILGSWVKDFTAKVQEITHAEHVIPVSSGTAALHISLMAGGIKPGDHVLVPSSSFVATANAVTFVGGVPFFIDAGLFLNPFKLRQFLGNATTKSEDGSGRIWEDGWRNPHKITAVIPVNTLGMPGPITDGGIGKIGGIIEVAKEFGLIVIEDAAAGLGSTYLQKHVGRSGLAGVISFNYNKIVTTHGGGVILTDDEFFAARCHQLSTTSRVTHPWLVEHDDIGWNYRMGQVNAALGMAQLERFDEIIKNKQELADRYREAFRNTRGVRFLNPECDVHSVPNNWLNAIVVDRHLRDETFKALHAEGIHARALPTPLHTLPPYRNHPKYYGDMQESRFLFETVICLPSGPELV